MGTPDVQLMLGHTSDTAEKQAGPSIGSVAPSEAGDMREMQFTNDLTVPLSRNSSLAKDSREAQANNSVMKTTTRTCAASGKSGAGLPLSEKKKNTSSKSLINKMLRDTSLIPDKILSFEVHLSVVTLSDVLVYTAHSSIGHEYEELLKRKLRERGVGYQTEEELRALGCDKTPDTRLDVPIGVGGRVVNWIESKASFGDRENHRSYLNDQLWSYWNRFGPGLVIYWFGYIDELNYLEDKGILVRDCFPDDIVTMDPLAVKTSGLKHL
ncbi:CDAN1-interacting nuclease 1-like [Hyalella azteca]|uniref:CDAN1-interacting nuclease 1 n=1 Tax=Hyalella azteca TaxID=294128 RepID=A0A979FYG8_HYAAZ|nr:CDAN1-interacting nuclease 1-like [Hyalella azteca]